jgi:hypothetical protein
MDASLSTSLSDVKSMVCNAIYNRESSLVKTLRQAATT